MPTTPLKIDILENGVRPRDWQPRKSQYKVPLRLLRLCLLGMFLPSVLVAGPMYLRYRVYSEQLYPLTISDQRLIDAKISTTWCQSQLVTVNTTFNAYLMNEEPKVKTEVVPVSMTRHLILEDDMKEYWGFYLLRGSSVTVSTCVRWPGASLTMIRGHKHLHECAFIGDDSSEELEELFEVAKETGLLTVNSSLENGSPSNMPEKMKRARQEVQFHHKDNAVHLNSSKHIDSPVSHNYNSHELDAKAMRSILTELFAKTLGTKNKQKENPHHRYEGVFMETANIDKPPVGYPSNSGTGRLQRKNAKKNIYSSSNDGEQQNATSSPTSSKLKNEKDEQDHNKYSGTMEFVKTSGDSTATEKSKQWNFETSTEKKIITEVQQKWKTTAATSAEIFQDILQKINSLGHRGKQMLQRLMDEIEGKSPEGETLRRMVNATMNDENLSPLEKRRRRRELILSSPLRKELTEEDEEDDTVIEEGMLHPDGVAEDRGTVNETTLNDRSNSEFWSSFSSSEERLLECEGLILNLPLTPHRQCTPKHETQHDVASFANTVTYRVPTDGYYFFVFNSENEIQPNYLRVRFDLLKTVYNISNPIHACKNSTQECSLPFKMFSNERTILELPLSGNDSQWNEEYVVVSTCVPRTGVYVVCIITVPLLILLFAFH